MKEDDKKFFDVNKYREGPPPTSKPIITGQSPMAGDPMIREALPTGRQEGKGDEPKPTDVIVSPQPDRQPSTPTPLVDSQFVAPAAKTPTPSVPPAGLPTGQAGDEELHLPAGKANYHHKPRVWVWAAVVIIILASIYAAIDAKTDWLPFHIFTKDRKSTSSSNNTDSQTGQPVPLGQTNTPAGFAQYQPTGTTISFAYPSAWGTPTTITDPGFSQRGGGKQSDGVHAYLVNFANNKDVEIAITSSKYLPAARTALYYDFLQWCVGTHDSKFYKQTLRFNTTDEIDSPSTVTCDQGPLTDATKISDAIIVEGDVYTANLSDASLPAFRVKDAKMTNGDDIKKLLNTIAAAPANTLQ